MSATYEARKGELTHYFDRTAAETWARLTSDAPVSRIRATVRAGRDEMRARLMSWLPANLAGRRVLDAGCGTGALAREAAARGAEVVAVDVAGELIRVAAERTEPALAARIDWRVGDFAEAGLGRFDHVVLMDSLIHYRAADMLGALDRLAPRTAGSILMTVAPRTALLTVMHAAGQLFPRSDRSPAIQPVAVRSLRRRIETTGLELAREARVARGFYISHALELVRS